MSKLDQLRALREARYVASVVAAHPRVRSARLTVADVLAAFDADTNATKVAKPATKVMGRPRKYATDADRYRAYRARKKARQ